MSARSLLDHLSALEDPRPSGKVGYRLPEILLAVLCGTMAGTEDFVEIARWANRKRAFLRRLLALGRGVPSHDTLNDVVNALPAAAFSECFTAWVESLRESEPDIVAVARKGNEITAIPLLLERLERTGALVAIDAVGNAEAIRARGPTAPRP